MQPIRWLVEILGSADSDINGDDEDNYSQGNRNYTTNGSSSGRNSSHSCDRKDGQCMHEDGGRYAVFESTESDPVRARVSLSTHLLQSTHMSSLYALIYHHIICLLLQLRG